MTHQAKFTKNDEYYTPRKAVIPICEKIKPCSIVWCPFDTEDSEFVKVLKECGHTVIATHISQGEDFFAYDPPNCDYIISNPPYSLKTEVIERLFDIGTPFAMLLNFQGIFDSKKRFNLFKENGIEILVIYPRIEYDRNNKELPRRTPFQSAYVCWRILKKQIEFYNVEEL